MHKTTFQRISFSLVELISTLLRFHNTSNPFGTENTSYFQKLHIPVSPSDPDSLNIRFLVIPAYSGITIVMTCIILDTVHKSQFYHDVIYVILFLSSILCVMVYSLSVGLFLSFSSFVMSPGIFQVCRSCCVLSYVFLFSFLDSSNPKTSHYPICSCCFVMKH